MRDLNLEELTAISGGISTTTLFGSAGGAAGAYYGFTLTAPLGLMGTAMAITGTGGLIWEGVYYSVGLVVTGTIAGGILGALTGSTVGAVTDKVLESATT